LVHILALALVLVELHLNVAFCKLTLAAGKLHVAVFTYAEQWAFAHDPKSSLPKSSEFPLPDLAGMVNGVLSLFMRVVQLVEGLFVFHAPMLRQFSERRNGTPNSNCTTTVCFRTWKRL